MNYFQACYEELLRIHEGDHARATYELAQFLDKENPAYYGVLLSGERLRRLRYNLRTKYGVTPEQLQSADTVPEETGFRRVILESPFAGDEQRNIEYARRAVRDSLSRGEAPIASHLLYTQEGILDDNVPAERDWGINAGLSWRGVADATVVYEDLGISSGMKYGIAAALNSGLPVEHRKIGEKP